MKKVLSLLLHPLLLSLVGLLLIGALIWIVGPLLTIGALRPLASDTARYVAIGCVALLMVLKRLAAAWRAKRRNANLVDALVPAPRAEAAPPTAGEAEVETLRGRFADALAVLRHARVTASGRRPGWRDWLALSTRQYLYQLPWYIFIGAPGSGKTTALLHSGLTFPLARQLGTDAIRGVGGTRNCDWWFTDDAVLIDTAGRYTTQESDRDTDRTAWHGFLALLKRARPRQAINGVLLTVSVSDLLTQHQSERDTMAAALRTRLRELVEQLGTRFPVYVLVTKADLLAGFTPFFAQLGHDERAQVFGFTLPFAPDAPLSNDGFRSALGAQLDALEERLVARVPERLQAEPSVAQRAAIISFPQQFSMLKPIVQAFVADVFAESKHADHPLVRGVYFTSGTQEGAPIDRVMSTLARAFGLERDSAPPQSAQGRSYFVRRLLTDVVFAEQGLAGGNLQWIRRHHLLRLSGYAAIAALFVALAGVWTWSYTRNRSYVAAVGDAARAAKLAVAADSTSTASDWLTLLPILASVRHLATVGQVAAAAPPWSMQWGLWQGAKLDAAAESAYRKLLDDLFVPKLSARIEEQLRGANAANPGFAYEALKAYLMLHRPEHQDADALKTWIVTDWERSLPREVDNDARAQLAAHLNALLARGAIHSNLPFDDNLVAHTRAMLAHDTLAQRVYGRLRQQGVGAGYPDFTIARAGGPNASLVFTRASGAPLTQGVPGLYSFDGYHEGLLKALDAVALQLAAEEPWVLGIRDQSGLPKGDPAAMERLGEDVRLLYLQDYARIWSTFLDDIRLVHVATLPQATQLARILSAPDSPLAALLTAASRETTLAAKPAADRSVVDQAGDKLSAARQKLLKIIGEPDPTKIAPVSAGGPLESIVDARFSALRALVTSAAPGQAPPLAQTLALINDVYMLFAATDAALQQKTAPPVSDVPAKLRAQADRMPEPLRTALVDLGAEGAAQAQGAKRANLSADLKESVFAFCTRAIAGRYPFNPSSATDVLPADFGALFAPGGKFDDFFQKNLAADVDVSARPWAFKKIDGGTGQISPAGLAQFERAATLRDVFFRAGKLPSLTLQFKPVEMDPSILQFTLDVDGQTLTYAHGPQLATTIQWPGTSGTGRVSLQLNPPPTGAVGGLVFEGPWALFRMFDGLSIENTAQPERFFVTFDVEGRKARFEVIANSVQNPFRLADLRAFSCPGSL